MVATLFTVEETERVALRARWVAMVWTPEPTYEKPDISVRATTLYYQIAAPMLLPWIDRRLLNLFRCREGKCFFQRNREHPPTGKEFDRLAHLEPVEQKNGRTEQYLFVESAEEIVACAKVQTVEFHGWGSRAGAVETPDRLVIDLDPGDGVGFGEVKDAAFQLQRSFDALGLESFALLSGGKGIHVLVPIEPVAEWKAVRKFREELLHRARRGGAGPLHRSLAEERATRPDLPRFPAQSAHRDGDHALFGARPRRNARRDSGELGRAPRRRSLGRLHDRRRRSIVEAFAKPQARKLGKGCPTPAGARMKSAAAPEGTAATHSGTFELTATCDCRRHDRSCGSATRRAARAGRDPGRWPACSCDPCSWASCVLSTLAGRLSAGRKWKRSSAAGERRFAAPLGRLVRERAYSAHSFAFSAALSSRISASTVRVSSGRKVISWRAPR